MLSSWYNVSLLLLLMPHSFILALERQTQRKKDKPRSLLGAHLKDSSLLAPLLLEDQFKELEDPL